jgi:hypothetical protein
VTAAVFPNTTRVDQGGKYHHQISSAHQMAKCESIKKKNANFYFQVKAAAQKIEINNRIIQINSKLLIKNCLP